MSLNLVTLTWDFTDLIQSGEAGTLSIQPTSQLTDATDGLIIPALPPKLVNFTGGTGQLAGIVANDNANITPTGTGYTITVTAPNGQVVYGPTTVVINFAAGATQKLSSLTPAVIGPVVTTYMLQPSGTPVAGQAPLATGTGQASAWGNVLSNPMTTLGDLLYENATPAAARLAGDTSNTRKFLRTQATAGVAQAPAWDTIQAGDVPVLNQNTTGTASNVTGTVAIANGGTGATTQQAALDAIAGAVTSGLVLRGNGTHVTLAALQASDVPTLNQNTTGTAANVTGTVAIGNGGTGQTSQQAAINALTGTQSAGKYLRSDGTNATLASIVAGDVPTLNQNTTGTAANVTGTVAIANGGTGQTSAAAAYNALSPMTTLGDIEYESGANTASRLAGNTSATKNFLTQTGNGSVSAAPAWGTIAAGDLPAATTSTQGAVILDGTAGDIKPTSTAAAAGAAGKAADASHVHVQNYGGIFGDGSDGAVAMDGTNTFAGFASTTGSAPNLVYTLTRDVFATTFTLSSGKTLNPAGYRIFCAGTFTNNGTIQYLGTAASGATAGVGPGGGTLQPPGNGATGVTGAGAQAPAVQGGAGVGSGGAGGTGTSGAGGAARNPGFTSAFPFRQPSAALAGIMNGKTVAASQAPTGGAGGSSGAGDGTNAGGGGGSGGGLIVIFAWSASNSATGTITVAGGAGGSPAAGNCGGGGGGGGGNVIVYTLSAWTNSGTTTLTGGGAGTHTGTGTDGSAGGTGSLLNVVVQ